MRLENMVKLLVKDGQRDVGFFLCGPEGLTRTAAITLKFLGFETAQIRRELFVIERPPAPRPDLQPHDLTIQWKGVAHRVHASEHSSILEAALEAGIQIPYSCRGGRCSACAALLRKGKIHMTVNEVLTDRELEQGWILTCTGYADDDEVVVEIV